MTDKVMQRVVLPENHNRNGNLFVLRKSIQHSQSARSFNE
jgi:hypothetical protein